MKRMILVMLGWMLAGLAWADFGLPPEVKLPPQIGLYEDQELTHEDMAEVSFKNDAAGSESVVRRGEHFRRWLRYTPKAGEPALGYYNGSEQRIFDAVWGTLKSAGWTLIFVDESKSGSVFHWQKPGREIWLQISLDAPQAYVGVEAIILGSVARSWKHPVPKDALETFTDEQPFPYLSPMPGSTEPRPAYGEGPLDVSMAFGVNASTDPVLIGTGVRSRSYQGPKTLSVLQFMAEQRAALTEAGWQVLYPAKAEQDAEAAGLIAHYQKGARNLWVAMGIEYGSRYTYQVVDLGAEDWLAKLKKDCHLALRGVQFDFNQATLKPVSEQILSKALQAIKALSGQAIEIQGHTDSVGDDASNQGLSERRAQAVQQWLIAHGVQASQLSAKGYGETMPVDDNGTDAGRAQNRRVELKLTGCQGH